MNSKSPFLVVIHKAIVLMAVAVEPTEGAVVLQIECNISLATKIIEHQCKANIIFKISIKVGKFKAI